jgi:hypothetical protein
VTKDEVAVLNYVACGMGGPDSIRKSLRATYRDLIDRRLIKTVVLYELTDDGEKALDAALPRT